MSYTGQRNGQIASFESFLNNNFSQVKVSNKTFHITGYFNLNLLDHDTNKKVQNFLNLVYKNGMIPTINKPTRVTRKIATAIDYFPLIVLLKQSLKLLFLKVIYSIIFLFNSLAPSSATQRENKRTFIYKRIFNTEIN